MRGLDRIDGAKPLSRFSRERRGPPAKRVGGEGLHAGLGKTLTSQAFGLGDRKSTRLNSSH